MQDMLLCGEWSVACKHSMLYLQLDARLCQVDVAGEEGGADGGRDVSREHFADVPHNQARFAHACKW